MYGMVTAVLSAACSLAGRGGRAPARALVALAIAVLAVGACAPFPTRTLVAPAPVDAGLSLYTISSDGALIAYRASDGVQRWTYTSNTRYLCASGGPFYYARMVFCFTETSDISHPILTAVRASDGRPLWTLPMSGNSPLYAMAGPDIVLLVPADNSTGSPPSLLVVRLSDGVPIRNIPMPSPGINTFAADGNTAYFCTPNGVLYAYRLSDGKTLWQDTVAPASKPYPDGELVDHSCFPVAADGSVYAWVPIGSPPASSPMRHMLIAVRGSDGHILWRRPVTTPWPPVVRDGTVFVAAEQRAAGDIDYQVELLALRASDGATLWHSPTAASLEDGYLGFVTEAGGVVAFELDGMLRAASATNGASLWQRQPPPYRRYGLVGSVSNVVFVTSYFEASIHDLPPLGTDTSHYLFALRASDGSVYWKIPLDGLGATLGADT